MTRKHRKITFTSVITTLAFILLVLFALPAFSPAASKMYVVNHGFNNDGGDPIKKFTVSQYDIDSATGALAPIGPLMVDEGSRPRSIVVSPDGRSAYVANFMTLYFASISQYDIDPATGALTAKSPPTVAADGMPNGIAVSPDGKSAYVANMGSASNDAWVGSVTQYDIDSTTGALTQKSPSAVEAGSQPVEVTVSPDGRSAYALNADDGTVSQYDIDSATGKLSAKSTETVEAGAYPLAIAVSPDGGNAYVTSLIDDNVSQYDIDPATGSLSAGSLETVVTGRRPYAIALSPDGESAYVVNRTDGSVSQYNIDESGALSAKSTPTVATGGRPNAIALSPDGESAYVTNDGDDNVSQYDIDPPTGNLSPKSTETVATGLNPRDIVIASTHSGGEQGNEPRPVQSTRGKATACKKEESRGSACAQTSSPKVDIKKGKLASSHSATKSKRTKTRIG